MIHLVDEHNPGLPVIWNKAVEMPRYEVPAGATVFAKDRWTDGPLIAGMQRRRRRRALGRRITRRQPATSAFPISCRRSADLVRTVLPQLAPVGLFRLLLIGRAPIPIISPNAGARPASAPCTWPPGIITMPIPHATNI